MAESLPLDIINDILQETDFPRLHYMILRHVSRHFAKLIPIREMNRMTMVEHIAETPYIRLIGWAGIVGYAISPSACTAADNVGNLPMLKHLRRCNINWGEAPIGSAARGHLDVVQWAFSNGSRTPGRQSKVMVAAAANGHLDICEFLRDIYRCTITPEVVYAAVDTTQKHIMMWILNISIRFRTLMSDRAYATDNIKSARYLASIFIIDFPKIQHEIFTRGSLVLLEWRIGCGDNPRQYAYNAARNGHLHVLVWFMENGHEIDFDACIPAASTAGHTECVHWLEQNSA